MVSFLLSGISYYTSEGCRIFFKYEYLHGVESDLLLLPLVSLQVRPTWRCSPSTAAFTGAPRPRWPAPTPSTFTRSTCRQPTGRWRTFPSTSIRSRISQGEDDILFLTWHLTFLEQNERAGQVDFSLNRDVSVANAPLFLKSTQYTLPSYSFVYFFVFVLTDTSNCFLFCSIINSFIRFIFNCCIVYTL